MATLPTASGLDEFACGLDGAERLSRRPDTRLRRIRDFAPRKNTSAE